MMGYFAKVTMPSGREGWLGHGRLKAVVRNATYYSHPSGARAALRGYAKNHVVARLQVFEAVSGKVHEEVPVTCVEFHLRLATVDNGSSYMLTASGSDEYLVPAGSIENVASETFETWLLGVLK